MAAKSSAVRVWLCLFNVAMGFSLAIYVYEAFAYNAIFLGRILPALGRGGMSVPFMVAFNLAWGLAFVSHVRAHLADPGAVPRQWHRFAEALGPALPVVPSKPEFQPGRATLCRQCGRSRPERAHHCQFCGICVLRYDHHCPWINNCVGSKNHKYFLLVVLYSCLASLIGLATSMPELVYCARVLAGVEDRSRWEAKHLTTPTVVAFLIFDLLALLTTVLLTLLLVTYLPFAAQNLTTVEETYTNMANPFDLGGATANLEQIFGAFGPDWFLPVQPFRPQSDGVYFPRPGERQGLRLLDPREAQRLEPEARGRTPRLGRAPSFSSTNDSLQDLSLIGDEELDLQAERLWRLRYYARPPPLQPGKGPEDASAAGARRWGSCCSREDAGGPRGRAWNPCCQRTHADGDYDLGG